MSVARCCTCREKAYMRGRSGQHARALRRSRTCTVGSVIQVAGHKKYCQSYMTPGGRHEICGIRIRVGQRTLAEPLWSVTRKFVWRCCNPSYFLPPSRPCKGRQVQNPSRLSFPKQNLPYCRYKHQMSRLTLTPPFHNFTPKHRQRHRHSH